MTFTIMNFIKSFIAIKNFFLKFPLKQQKFLHNNINLHSSHLKNIWYAIFKLQNVYVRIKLNVNRMSGLLLWQHIRQVCLIEDFLSSSTFKVMINISAPTMLH